MLTTGLHWLRRHQHDIGQSLERLATGKRINRASDDPSGLIAGEHLGGRLKELEQLLLKGEEAMHYAGVADGALSVLSDLAAQLESTVLAAANLGGGFEAEREALQIEADSIIRAMELTVNTTSFRGERILADGFGMKVGDVLIGMSGINLLQLGQTPVTVTEQAGAGDEGSESEAPAVPTEPTTHEIMVGVLGLRTGGRLNLLTGDLEAAQRAAKGARESIDAKRAGIGATLRHKLIPAMNVWRVEMEETSALRSSIVDADVAEEMARLVRGQLLEKAAIASILIGRQAAESALQLLQSAKR